MVTVPPDAPALVRVLGATLARTLGDSPKAARRATKLRGGFALADTASPRAATIRFAEGGIDVVAGADTDAKITVRTEIDRMGDTDAPKPSIIGLARHPLFAMAVKKFLDAPLPAWTGSIEHWVANANSSRAARELYRYLPPAIAVTNKDDLVRGIVADGLLYKVSAEVPDPADMEIHGSDATLAALFGHAADPATMWLAGKLQVRATTKAAQALQGLCFALMTTSPPPGPGVRP